MNQRVAKRIRKNIRLRFPAQMSEIQQELLHRDYKQAKREYLRVPRRGRKRWLDSLCRVEHPPTGDQLSQNTEQLLPGLLQTYREQQPLFLLDYPTS